MNVTSSGKPSSFAWLTTYQVLNLAVRVSNMALCIQFIYRSVVLTVSFYFSFWCGGCLKLPPPLLGWQV